MVVAAVVAVTEEEKEGTLVEEEVLVVVEQEAGKAEVEKGGVGRALVVVLVGKCSPAVS